MPASVRHGAAFNRVLELCRDGSDDRELRLGIVEVLRRVVGFDSYVWLLTDPETSVGSSPLADVPFLEELPLAIRLKYLTPVNRWTSLTTPAALLREATGGDLSESLMWRDLLHRYAVVDGASTVFRDRFGCWGFLDLWRLDGRSPFSPPDAEFLADIAAPVTEALRSRQADTFSLPRSEAPDLGGPVVLLLGPTLAVRAQTPSTPPYLQALVPPGGHGGAAVPAGAYNVAAQLVAREEGVDPNEPAARVHLGGGTWLTMRAARLEAAAPDGRGDIAVTIEPTAPGDRLALYSRACGLSARETELLGRLAEGCDTRDLARAMFLSQNTVQDHLKSIFAKTGTRTRGMLVSRALGT